MKTRAELVEMLDALEVDLPDLLDQAEPADRISVFASAADDIRHAAGPEDSEYVSERLHSMVAAYGLAASDDAA
jgi:hypothetical protein